MMKTTVKICGVPYTLTREHDRLRREAAKESKR